eukprot:9880012-Lingulodinium_polyedra.AAC.1
MRCAMAWHNTTYRVALQCHAAHCSYGCALSHGGGRNATCCYVGGGHLTFHLAGVGVHGRGWGV